MKHQVQFLIIMIFSFVTFEGLSQEEKVTNEKYYENSTLFNSVEPLGIKLFLNRKAVFRDVGKNRRYHPAVIKYTSPTNEAEEINISLKTRGNFRRNPQNCNMAPLRFKIPKEASKSDVYFAGQNKLKLVLPCLKDKEKYQEYVILEYLIYKSYALLTEMSYKTRLVNITLIDSLKPEKTLQFTSFFLEETKQLAKRNNGKILKFKRFHPSNVNRNQMTILAVFQYLIGNTDWSVDVSHNTKLLFINNQTTPYTIPFDFDWSGIINVPYAVPSKQLNISSVRERLFRGYKRSMEEYKPVIKLFNDKKKEIYNLYQNCEWLSEKTKKNTLKYMDDFYKVINDPKKVETEFINNARKS